MQQQYHLHQSWLWLFLLPLLGLSSCSGADTDDAGNHPAASTMPISFTALSKWDEAQSKSSTSPHTRLSEDATTKTLSFDRNDAIGVFAYLNNSDSPNFMNNQKVTYDGSNWNYSPVKYWPNNEEDKLSFYAYYPYRETFDGDTIKAISSSNNKLTINYCCPNANIDLMASKPITGQTYTESQGTVPLKFQHLLARVKFRFTVENANEQIDYTPVIHVIKYPIPYSQGKIICNIGTESTGLELRETSNPTTIIRFVTKEEGEAITREGIDIPEFTAYLLPCTFPSSDDGKSKFTFSLNNVECSYTLTKGIDIKAGQSYTLNFKVKTVDNATNFFITSFSIWEEGSEYNGDLN